MKLQFTRPPLSDATMRTLESAMGDIESARRMCDDDFARGLVGDALAKFERAFSVEMVARPSADGDMVIPYDGTVEGRVEASKLAGGTFPDEESPEFAEVGEEDALGEARRLCNFLQACFMDGWRSGRYDEPTDIPTFTADFHPTTETSWVTAVHNRHSIVGHRLSECQHAASYASYQVRPMDHVGPGAMDFTIEQVKSMGRNASETGFRMGTAARRRAESGEIE